MKKGILFDKDGTIMDVASYWVSLSSQVAEYVLKELIGITDENIHREMMKEIGVDDKGEIIDEGLIIAGTNYEISVVWHNVMRKNGYNLDKEVIDFMEKSFIKFCGCGEVVPTTDKLIEIFKKLKKIGYNIGIATSDEYDSAVFCIDKLGISHLVDDIFSADLVENPKPSSDTMNLVYKRWKIPAKDIIMIGDSVGDMMFAKNSGCKGVFISENDFLPDGAQTVVDNIENLDLDFLL